MGTICEYMEIDLHGDPGTRTDGPGAGTLGYMSRINKLAKDGWRLIWVDRDTNVHILGIMEREIPDDRKDNAADPTEKADG